MKIHKEVKIGHIHLTVANLENSLKFYRDIFGRRNRNDYKKIRYKGIIWRDILKEISATVPQYSDINPKNLGESGVRWMESAIETRIASLTLTAYSSPAEEKGAN